MTNQSVKTALVTAGAKRLGRAIVEGLAAEGFRVVIHAHESVNEAEALASAINASGGRAATVFADLTKPEEARGLVAKASAAIGTPLNLLVNNASAFVADTIHDINMDVWRLHFALHVEAPSLLASAFAAQLPDDAEGLIVNMVDQRVLKLNPRFYSYTLSKSALWTATRTMAQALSPRIRVNAIGPGPSMPSERQARIDFDRQVAAVPLRRGPAPEEFARTINYLFHARSVTGQMITLDGGQHLAWQTPDILEIKE